MSEQQTAVVDTAENNNPQVDAPETKNEEQKGSPTDGSDVKGQDVASVGKENANAKSPYDDDIERLKKLAEHQKEVIQHKDRALQAVKKKNKELAENLSSDDSLVEEESAGRQDELKKEVEGLKLQYEQLAHSLNVKTAQDEINQLTNDPKEREAILLALEYQVKPSGNRSQDIYAARAIVNAHAIFEAGKIRGKQDAEEENTTRYSMSRSSGGKTGGTGFVDPVVADLLKKFNRPDAIKFIK